MLDISRINPRAYACVPTFRRGAAPLRRGFGRKMRIAAPPAARHSRLMNDRDYVLGTHDEEVERLGLQHSVWRAKALDGWRRAGIGAGMTVLDVGAGPGFAATDLAEIVGAEGRVI